MGKREIQVGDIVVIDNTFDPNQSPHVSGMTKFVGKDGLVLSECNGHYGVEMAYTAHYEISWWFHPDALIVVGSVR